MRNSPLGRRTPLKGGGALKRTTPLKQGTGLRRDTPLGRSARLCAHKTAKVSNPARDEFKRVERGICAVCGARGMVRRHHVIYEQHLRQVGGDPWDIRNGLWVGLEHGITCNCHERHHNASKRIPMDALSAANLRFATELFGAERAAAYLDRRYAPSRGEKE